MDILTLGLGLGLGLGRVLGLKLRRQDVPGLKNTGVNFLASGQSHWDVADPLHQPIIVDLSIIKLDTFSCNRLVWVRIRLWVQFGVGVRL